MEAVSCLRGLIILFYIHNFLGKGCHLLILTFSELLLSLDRDCQGLNGFWACFDEYSSLPIELEK